MLRFLPLLLFVFTTSFAQTYTSTIRGTVRDADTGSPLVGATVQLVQGQTGSITGADGTFRFDELAVGRYQVTVTYVGYETISIPEILLESGKESIIQVKLSPAGRQLEEATVSAARPVAFNSVQPITMEQTFRYAATYMDPARVATSFPGIAAANDQANGLVVRGNSPNSMQWRLEGVEIVNPNHLSNAGTFSDRPTSTGGGVNILSTQLLGTSNFLAGPFPAQYGNVNGGVLDMNLRKGNDEKTEYTAQASLLGLDFAVEGPFSRKSKASYLVNYRYSFTGLLGAMGVNFGGEDIRFQDLSFNVSLPTNRAGTFTFFGMGGISKNMFEGQRDSTLWENQKDTYDIDYRNNMVAAGITHAVSLGKKASLRTVLAYSGLKSTRNAMPLDTNYRMSYGAWDTLSVGKKMLSFNTALTYRAGFRSLIKAGVFVNSQSDHIRAFFTDSPFITFVIRPYASWTYNPVPAVTAEVGVHGFYSDVRLAGSNPNWLIEPRASIKWQMGARTQLTGSYGLHSQLQSPMLYLNPYPQVEENYNANISPARSHHFVLGWQQQMGKAGSLKLEAYWQEQFDIATVERYNFSAVNLAESFYGGIFENIGTARNYGLEATFQKYLTDQFYLLISGSVYDATYTIKKGGERFDSRFNGRHTFSFTGGKEITTGRGGIWGFNTKILWLGGFRDRQINASSSRESGQTIYTNQLYSVKLKDYFRPDLRIYWKKSNAKYSRTLALDLQNVAGIKNTAYQYYDMIKQNIVTQNQLGLIPVISYRWEF